MQDFEVKPYPELWHELNMDVERFDKARQMLGGVYPKCFCPRPTVHGKWPISTR